MNTIKPLWTPSREFIASTNIFQFAKKVFKKEEYDYANLHRFSCNNLNEFWSALWDFSSIIGTKGEPPFYIENDFIYNAEFFPKATLNYAENLLRRRDDHIALIGRMEGGGRKQLSYKELYDLVSKLAFQLRKDGLQKGDRVAGYIPNCIEAVIGMLAVTSIGAVWTSCSPDFGFQGVLDRFGQVEPKFLIAANAYSYNGKIHSCYTQLKSLSESITSIEKIIVFDFFTDDSTPTDIDKVVKWENYINNNASEITFEQLPFNAPLFIMYSSGTTGKPKCIIHKVGGVLLEHQKEHLLHTNISEKDIFFYYSTCGWMMWNWLVSGLACGATLVLLDGSPFYPNHNYLIDLIDEENISIFGVSAKFIGALSKLDVIPKETHQLSSLKTILSTGSPLAAEHFTYVYSSFKSDVLLSSISGGTDLIGAFVSGNPTLPVYAGELQCKGLAFDLDIVDEEGNSLPKGKGELICRKAFPSMPIGFWNDSNNERYFNAYYKHFDNIWAQGDFAEITPQNGLIIHGRSDAVLNPGGVRIGTAEIYRQAVKIDEVQECIAIGQVWKDDCRVILFVILKDNIKLTTDIIHDIKNIIRKNATPRHVPAKIIQVKDIPKTRSGKIVELAVRNVVHGIEVKNTAALQNPEALHLFKNIKELQTEQ
ncbi:acetoacetate--CoA ligase [Flammeovirga kamogawensis]|uniref:Acetoacetate--CoA ligase n=1 Tax=Flammeovirga kamogawensis TaxID=373891 RepID=A0ABX8H236_9BACT|nr:acetoacetate--CoA ligase [Flammeovirga kamogawensis]MBB6462568.1 acetoacetyl-CoA synthetase [Flammeovirga kamogawensis]QWG09683.1 acetoacetate--CoA ligase [Flammeovirga kamogawensis]TRX65195.1 acetoacetate--CoA ligase [Flammeovirga kamogawensis]